MRILWGACLLLLAGCGAAYITPKVGPEAAEGLAVEVVAMTPASVAAANRAPYTPRRLPDAFRRTAGAGTGLRGAGPTPQGVVDPERPPAALALRLPPDPAGGPYQVGVGDVLLLATRSAGTTVEELSGLLAAQSRRQGYTVQDDGAIAIPDVGRIPVAGLTLEEAEARVFQSLLDNQIDPTFSLEIAEFNSQRVSIGGAVAQPTVAPVTLTPLTLDQALAAAGGIATRDRDFAVIRLYRGGTLYQVPVREYLGQPRLQKLRLADGDALFVDTEYELDRAQAYFAEQITLAEFRRGARAAALAELQTEIGLRRAALNEARETFEARTVLGAEERDYVYITGEVTAPRRLPLPYEHRSSLADALFDEGGVPTRTGNPAQIYVIREAPKTPGRVTALHLDARNPVNTLMATKLELRPDDIIFVAEQPITRWNRVIDQFVPSLINTGVAAVQ